MIRRRLWVPRRGFVLIEVTGAVWHSYLECLLDACDVLALAYEV